MRKTTFNLLTYDRTKASAARSCTRRRVRTSLIATTSTYPGCAFTALSTPPARRFLGSSNHTTRARIKVRKRSKNNRTTPKCMSAQNYERQPIFKTFFVTVLTVVQRHSLHGRAKSIRTTVTTYYYHFYLSSISVFKSCSQTGQTTRFENFGSHALATRLRSSPCRTRAFSMFPPRRTQLVPRGDKGPGGAVEKEATTSPRPFFGAPASQIALLRRRRDADGLRAGDQRGILNGTKPSGLLSQGTVPAKRSVAKAQVCPSSGRDYRHSRNIVK